MIKRKNMTLSTVESELDKKLDKLYSSFPNEKARGQMEKQIVQNLVGEDSDGINVAKRFFGSD